MDNIIEIEVKDFITKLVEKFSCIKEVYIFGSRGIEHPVIHPT